MLKQWARTIVEVVSQEFPAAMHHTSLGPGDTDCLPSALHPAFWGSFDWHSCVHMLATGVKLEQLLIDAPLTSLLNSRLTADNLAAEAEYLRAHPTYERPYGLAWAAHLVKVCRGSGREAALVPLEAQVTANIEAWLDTQQWPVRHGVHDNSALALLLVHDALPALRGRVEEVARAWFGQDRDYPYAWEVSGHDFLSGGLAEAALMRRVLAPGEFETWLAGFLPEEAYAFYLEPVQVAHPEDGKQAHLIGLMLTRAWLLRELGRPHGTEALIEACLPHLTGENFMATHWLITYALLAENGLN